MVCNLSWADTIDGYVGDAGVIGIAVTLSQQVSAGRILTAAANHEVAVERPRLPARRAVMGIVAGSQEPEGQHQDSHQLPTGAQLALPAVLPC